MARRVNGNQRLAAATFAVVAVSFGAGRMTAPDSTRPTDAAIGTAVAKYPPCGTPRWTPGRTVPGPCEAKP